MKNKKELSEKMKKAEKDFAGLRVKLADEANKRIASRKRNSDGLADLYDELILAMLSVFDAYDKSHPFYERGVRVGYETFVSVVMDRMGMDVPDPDDCAPPGTLELWDELVHTPQKSLAKCPPTNEQNAALICVTHALEDLLCKISGEDNNGYFDHISRKWWTNPYHIGFHWQFWQLLRLTILVNIREIDGFFNHYETWKDILTDGGSNPICFMLKGSIDDYQKAWKDLKAKFYSTIPTLSLALCDHNLPTEIADYPRAFCFGKPGRPLHHLEHAVAKALKIWHELKFDYDNETLMWVPCYTMTHAAYRVRWTIIDYFRRARGKCKMSSPAHRKWLEAEAELVAHCGAEADPITPEVADRIVALANDAAHETWIEARTDTKTSAKDAAMDKALERESHVRLAEDQLTRLTSTFSSRSDELKAHVTSETDREIAAKAPKRVRKFGHEGNGLKGPKTRKMKEQKRIFDAFLKEHPEGSRHSRISRAHECWVKHPEWNKAAKASGEEKGYANHKSLAAAK